MSFKALKPKSQKPCQFDLLSYKGMFKSFYTAAGILHSIVYMYSLLKVTRPRLLTFKVKAKTPKDR